MWCGWLHEVVGRHERFGAITETVRKLYLYNRIMPNKVNILVYSSVAIFMIAIVVAINIWAPKEQKEGFILNLTDFQVGVASFMGILAGLVIIVLFYRFVFIPYILPNFQ